MIVKRPLSLLLAGLVLILAACTRSAVALESLVPIESITIGEDLTAIDLCAAIPQENIEAVLGARLVEPPTRYTLRGIEGSSGCFYEGPTDSDGERHFGYVVLTPPQAYDDQDRFQSVDVPGIGDAAYFHRGSDARQLWVKLADRTAFVIAFGDVARQDSARAIAALMVEAIQ